MITIVLLIVAAVLFTLAGLGIGGKFNLVAFGLLAWVLAVLIPELT